MRFNLTLKSLLLMVIFLSVARMGFCQTGLPSQVGVIQIGGQGFWDYLTVDTVYHRLYVSRSTHVLVIDLDKNALIGEIPNTPRIHGIAIARKYLRGFTSNGGDSTSTVFDINTDSIISVIKVDGRGPDAILYDPFSNLVFTFNGGSSTASAISAQSLKVLGTVPLSGRPEEGASDYKGRVFVNIEDKSVIDVIDPESLKVISAWPLAPIEEPSAMAIDRIGHRLFAAGHNNLMAVVDADSGRVVATFPIGSGVDGAAYDPITHMVFSSNGEGTLTVVKQENSDKYTVIGNVPTVKGARTIALDERTHRLYLPVGSRPDSTGVSKEDFRILIYQQ